MKQQTTRIVSLLMCLAITPIVFAYSFESGGIYYNITSSTNMTAAVTFYDKKDNVYGGTVSIPEKVTYQGKTYTVTAIGDYAFVGCTNLKIVKYSSKLTTIGNYAFSGCNGMTSIVIPAHITSIGNFAFNGCTSITGVTIEESETPLKLGYASYAITTGKGLFYDCPLYSVFIGRSLNFSTSNSYGNSPFAKNQTLTKVHFGNPVKSIPDYLLYGCTSFKIFQYNSQCRPTSVGKYAFSGCTSLTSSDIILPETVTSIEDGAFSGCTSLKNYTIPNHITSVGKYAFQNCDKLTNIVIKPSVTSIGTGCFNGCTSLTGVTIEEGENSLSLGCNYEIQVNAVSLGKGLFHDCPLYSVFIGRPLNYNSKVTTGYSPFANNKTLVKVHFGNPVKSVPAYLLYGCSAFNTILYNSECAPTSIGNYAFYGCTSIINGDNLIPESVKTIGDRAFSGCTKLERITVPAKVTSIGQYGFADCTKLASVTSQATTPPTIKENCFSGDTYSSATLYAPDKNAYAKAVGWKNFLNVVETGSPTPVKDIEMSYVGTNRTYQDEPQGIRPTGYRVLSLYWNDIKNSICQSFGINNATFEQHYNAEPIRDSNMEYQQYEKNASGQYVARTSGNYIGVISIQADMESSNDRLIWTLANADVQKLYSQWDRKSEKTFELSTAIKYEDIHGSHSHYGDVYIEFSTKVTFKPYSSTEMQGVVLNAANFPDANFRAALAEILGISEGDEITEEKIAATTMLSVPSKKIADLTGIEHFTALTDLECYNNQLTVLDVSKNTALTTLYCDNNQLTALDVSKNTALTTLYCDYNQLTTLDVSKNTALTFLNCNNNQLTALDVSKNTALTSLECVYNQLTALDVSKNTALTSLECVYNQLTTLDVSKNTALTSLACCNNQIKGAQMDALVNSLPTISSGEFHVFNSSDNSERNVCTKAQVAIAKSKGWNVYQFNGTAWEEYAGSTTGITIVENNDDATANWYTLDGKRLYGEPVTKGVYIVEMSNGLKKKVMVK